METVTIPGLPPYSGALSGVELLEAVKSSQSVRLTVSQVVDLAMSVANPAIQAAIAAVVGGAPSNLNTLIELATAIGNDPSFSATMTSLLAAKASLASPALTGAPTAPTAPSGTNTAQLANTAFVQAAVAALVASSPAALDTLNELAAALGNDPNFATTMLNALALKAPLASPALSGVPTAPTAVAGTNTAQLATTAFTDAVRALLQASIDLKASIASPSFTGTPSGPTATPGANTTQLATTEFVEAARVILKAYVDSSVAAAAVYPTAEVATNTSNLSNIMEAVKATSFSNSAAFSTIITSISNPLTRYSSAVDGSGYLNITQLTTNLLLIGPLLPDNSPINKLYEVEASFTGAVSGTGLALCINPSSSSTMDLTNHLSISWRSNGTLLYYGADGNALVAGITEVPAKNVTTPPAWVSGDILRMSLQYRGDPSSPTLRLYKNGIKVGEYALVGVPTGYMGATQRNQTNNTSVCTFRKLAYHYVNDTPRAFYINGLTTPGGNGTEANPFDTLANAIASVTESAGDLNILLKGGILRGSIQLPAKKYRKIRIAGRNGEDVIIRGSQMRTSGWTKTAGFTNVWERAHVFQGVTNSNSASGTIIDVTPANVDPLRPYQWRIYTRLAPNSGLAGLDAASPGASMVDTAALKMYVHPYNNTDPNTLSLEVSDQQFGVSIAYGTDTDNYFTDLVIENIHTQFSYASGFNLQRCVGARIGNCISEGAGAGYGFALNDFAGELYSCIATANQFDGFNASITGAVPLTRIPDTHFFDCFANYGSVAAIGDGFSNHTGQTWHIRGGGANYNGKCGFVPGSGDAYVYDFVAKGNYDSQIELFGSGGGRTDRAYARLHNCIVDGLDLDGVTKHTGFHLEAATGGPASMDIYGGRASNCSKALMVYSTSATPSDCVMNAYNVRDGGGNTTLKSNTAGVLNVFSDSIIA